jgi:hypothetical protein
MIVVEAGAVSARGGKPMGVFKDLAIQELNQKTSTAPECSVCGGYNQTASNFCFTCIGKYGGKTCDFCGVSVGSTGGFKCHEGCNEIYCAEHITKYGGGVK